MDHVQTVFHRLDLNTGREPRLLAREKGGDRTLLLLRVGLRVRLPLGAVDAGGGAGLRGLYSYFSCFLVSYRPLASLII